MVLWQKSDTRQLKYTDYSCNVSSLKVFGLSSFWKCLTMNFQHKLVTCCVASNIWEMKQTLLFFTPFSALSYNPALPFLLFVSFCSFAVFPRNYSVFTKGHSLPQLCKSSNSVQTLIIRAPTIFLSVVLDFQHFTPTPSVCNNIVKGMQRNLWGSHQKLD